MGRGENSAFEATVDAIVDEYFVPRENAEAYVRARTSLEDTPRMRAELVNKAAGLDFSRGDYCATPARLNGIMLGLQEAGRRSDGIVTLLEDPGSKTFGGLFLRENVNYSDFPPRMFRFWLVGDNPLPGSDEDFWTVLGNLFREFNVSDFEKSDEDFANQISYRLCKDLEETNLRYDGDSLRIGGSARVNENELESWPTRLYINMFTFPWEEFFSRKALDETMRKADTTLRDKHLNIKHQIDGLYKAGLQRDEGHQKRILSQYVRHLIDQDADEFSNYQTIRDSADKSLREHVDLFRRISTACEEGHPVFDSQRQQVRKYAYLARALEAQREYVATVLLK